MVVAYIFFIRKDKRKVWLIFLIVLSMKNIIGAFWENILSIGGRVEYLIENSPAHDSLPFEGKNIVFGFAVKALPEILFYGLLIYQAIILYRKRKIAADLSESSN